VKVAVKLGHERGDDDKENQSVNIHGDLVSHDNLRVEKQNSKQQKNAPNFEEFRMMPAIIKPIVVTNSMK
jgi:hypothetical protein